MTETKPWLPRVARVTAAQKVQAALRPVDPSRHDRPPDPGVAGVLGRLPHRHAFERAGSCAPSDERPNHSSTRAADGVAVHRHAVVERLVLEQIELKRPVEPAAVEGVEERPAGAEHGGVGEEQ